MAAPININEGSPRSICLWQDLHIAPAQSQRIILESTFESQGEAELVLAKQFVAVIPVADDAAGRGLR